MRSLIATLLLGIALLMPSAAMAQGDGPPEGQLKNLDEEFEQTLRDLAPLSPQEIRKLKSHADEQDQAAEPSPAKMLSATRMIALQAGTPPQVIRVSPGYSSTITFTDATGAPWPITSSHVGNPTAFSIVMPKDLQPGNLLSVEPLTNHASTNLTVTLLEAQEPVLLHLVTQSAVDPFRVSDAFVAFRIAQRGPNATTPVVGPQVQPTVSQDLLAFLDGVPPSGAQELNLIPQTGGSSIWTYRDRYYLRTEGTAIWPAWTSVVQNQSSRVYEMPRVPSLLLSIAGQTQTITVEE